MNPSLPIESNSASQDLKDLNSYLCYKPPEVLISSETVEKVEEIYRKSISENDVPAQNECKNIFNLIEPLNKK